MGIREGGEVGGLPLDDRVQEEEELTSLVSSRHCSGLAVVDSSDCFSADILKQHKVQSFHCIIPFYYDRVEGGKGDQFGAFYENNHQNISFIKKTY